jgi:hypothetical protein
MGNHHSQATSQNVPAASSSSRVSGIKADRLCFHKNTGQNVNLFNNNRTIERFLPDQLYSNGIAITDRALKADELFQVSSCIMSAEDGLLKGTYLHINISDC